MLRKKNENTASYMQEIMPFLETRRTTQADHDWDEQAIPSYLHPIKIVKYVFWERIKIAANLAKKSQIALDYGCGAGAMFPWLHKKFNRVFAYDIDLKSRKAAQEITSQKKWENIKIIDDAEFLKIDSASVDVIFALDVLEHVNELPQLLVEFHRVLKPDGVLIVSSPTENFFYKLARVFAGPGYKGEFHLRAAKEVESDLAQIFEVKLRKRIFPIFTFFRIVTATRNKSKI